MKPSDLQPQSLPIADVQSAADDRQLPIQQVGIRNVRYPITLRTARSSQPTVASFAMMVGLPAQQKGTHMSRFIALLESIDAPLDAAAFAGLLTQMLAKLEAQTGSIEAHFAYFIEKTAPVSGVKSLMDYEVIYTAKQCVDAAATTSIKVVVPVTSLCPCSKEISDYGAHNQRSHVTIAVDLQAGEQSLRVEDLIAIAEASASSELYGLLKRVDEKFVTEAAYDNPKFVEDLVRDVVVRLKQDARVAAFTVEVENFESIHNHSAYARIDSIA